MAPGSLQTIFDDRDPPLSKTVGLLADMECLTGGPMAAEIFGSGGEECVLSLFLLRRRLRADPPLAMVRYCQKYGAKREHCAKIASKSHKHSVNNPYAQFHNALEPEQVLKDKKVTKYLTRCVALPSGAACI